MVIRASMRQLLVLLTLAATLGMQSVALAAEGPIPSGTVITLKNWQQYKQFMPDGLQALFAGTHFWKLPPDFQMVIGPTSFYPLPEAFLLQRGGFAAALRMNIYILINDKVERDFQLIPNSTIDIAARTSASVTKTQIRSVLHETYDFARRNNVGFNLTYIDKDVPSPGSFGFETSYMRSLYQYGYDKAKAGDFWAKTPPSDGSLPSRTRDRRSTAAQ